MAIKTSMAGYLAVGRVGQRKMRIGRVQHPKLATAATLRASPYREHGCQYRQSKVSCFLLSQTTHIPYIVSICELAILVLVLFISCIQF